MIKIILIGLGNHAKNKIIPSIKKHKYFKICGIISSNKNFSKKLDLISYRNLKKSYFNKDINSYYVSTPISIHYKNILNILYNPNNKLIICEKSITNNHENTLEIVKRSAENNVFLFESYMYKYHPYFQKLKDILKLKNIYRNKSLNINCSYTIPKLKKSDHRNNNNLTGGRLYEIGCYPISIIYFLFKINSNSNINICKIINNSNFTYIKFHNGTNEYNLSWGYGLKYRNNFIIKTKKTEIRTYKIFGKIEKEKLFIKLKKGNNIEKIKSKNGDNFKYMFDYILNNHNNNKVRKKLYEEIINISSLLNKFNKLINS